MTRDGVIVCHHDDRVDRTTDGHGPIKGFTLAELKRLDAGYRFSPDGRGFPFRGKGVQIPTFEEVYALAPDVRINVEIKQRQPSMVRALWEFVQEHEVVDRILVAASFDPLVREFRRVSGGATATSAGERDILLFVLASLGRLTRLLPVAYDALQVPVRAGLLEVVTPRLLRHARAKNVAVHVWTIDDRHEMRRLLDLGVDGVMTDRPDLLVEVAGGR